MYVIISNILKNATSKKKELNIEINKLKNWQMDQ